MPLRRVRVILPTPTPRGVIIVEHNEVGEPERFGDVKTSVPGVHHRSPVLEVVADVEPFYFALAKDLDAYPLHARVYFLVLVALGIFVVDQQHDRPRVAVAPKRVYGSYIARPGSR